MERKEPDNPYSKAPKFDSFTNRPALPPDLPPLDALGEPIVSFSAYKNSEWIETDDESEEPNNFQPREKQSRPSKVSTDERPKHVEYETPPGYESDDSYPIDTTLDSSDTEDEKLVESKV